MSKQVILFAICIAIAQCAKLPRFGPVQVPVYHGHVTAYQGQSSVVQGHAPVQQSHYDVNQGVTHRPVGIVHQDSQVNPDGSYHNVWESENGIKVQEEASVKVLAKNKVAHTVTGTVSYTDNDGTPFVLSYTADENGFHAYGDHLPVGPPVPPAIARALEYIKKHPYVEKEVVGHHHHHFGVAPTVEVN
ncbi:endocuticle structural glycoprotein SgAbd-2-like [Chelonus insularis]|uniref:endocuticle structural glycoprotein SgAbd-2-like n=1 Tax=Chelonus insularis TaxID=460826 RepID=UPI00158C7B24|nr:endocuticle structural glycoprotein SgAbd-2-like [Chelonus insularis]